MDAVIENPSVTLARKLEKISEHFDIAMETTAELTAAIESEFKEEIETDTIMATLYEDFTFSRDTLKTTIGNAKKVLVVVSGKLEFSGELDAPINPELVASYASLVGIVNSSLKLLTEIYKNMTDVQIKIYKHTTSLPGADPQGGTEKLPNGVASDLKSILEEIKRPN